MRARLPGLAAGALLLSAACGQAPEPKPARPAPEPQAARTGVVERVETGLRRVAGTVAARESASLSARVMTTVRELPLREGESFGAGAVLVRLDDTALRSALAAAEAAELEASIDLQRLTSLLARDAATEREVDGARARAAGASAAVAAARDRVAYTSLQAPFAGRIAARPVHVGDVVTPGQTLLEIEGEGGHEVHATVDASLATTLRPGQELRVEVDGIDAPLTATVTAISPAGDPSTHRFLLKARLEPQPALRAGLFARLRVDEPGGGTRLMAPAAALVERGGLTGAWVVEEDGKARLRWIAVGRREGDRVEVRAGLREGERVVLAPGTIQIADGTPIREPR